jgi:hypothetical protein
MTVRADVQISSPYHSSLALNPAEAGFPGGVVLSPFQPNSVRCPWGFAPRQQRNGSTPT